MNKRFFLIIVLIFISYQLMQSADSLKTGKPEPLPEKEFKFPEHQSITLDNGLKIFVIEDHKQPTIAFRLLVSGGKSVDTLKPGTAEITTSLLTKGTKKLSALGIAKTIDGIGANISANASTDFITVEASGLKKHMNTILDVYTQVITNPSFPEKEFEKFIPQMLASIQQEKANPRAIASKMARKAIFGEKHPYATDATETSVNSIKVNDIKSYHETFFVPNNSTLAITGDVKPDEIIKEVKKRFKNWEKSKKPLEFSVPTINSLPLGVYFIERPGSVQSTIMFSSKALPYTNKDYDLLDIATSVISGGIAGRLFRTLREQYAFTYTPFGSLSQNKYTGRYFCGADVKNNVTDSALTVMLNQINSLIKTPASETELSRVKTYQSGAYKMAFESSDYVAALIQDADFYGKPIQDLENYASRIMEYSANSIKNIASQYLNPTKGYIIVVGSPEVKEKLSSFGKLYDYDLDLNPLSGEKAKMERVSLNPIELIEKYIKALGGSEAISQIHTVIDTAQAEMIYGSGPMKGLLIQYQKVPDKKYTVFDMGVFRQEVWVDAQEVWLKLNKLEKLATKDAEKFIKDALILKDTKLLEMGFTCEVLGKQGNFILMKAVSPKGFSSTYYFDSKTFLISKIERVEETASGTMPITESIKEYVVVDGVKFPKLIETVSPLYTIKTDNKYYINQPLEDSFFRPSE